jgi:hypothetical protein
MPELFTDSDLNELENREVVYFTDLPQRDFSTVWSETEVERPRKGARMRNPRHIARLKECAAFLRAAKKGEVSDWKMREILSTSDFPLLFGDILDTRLLNQYAATPNTWSQYAQRGVVSDFRQSRMIALDGIQQPLYSANRKAELEGVDLDNQLTETAYYTQVEVYERGVSYNWRMLMNRRGEFLSRIPALLTRAANRTEEKFATDLYSDSTGPDSTFFSSGNANIITSNPVFGISGLKTGLNMMYAQTDSGGDPIVIEGVTLIVPPVLQLTAQEVVRAITLELVPATSAAGTRIVTPPWVSRINPVVNWYGPIVDTSANKNTTWYLVANPQDRPAMEVTFLSGYETPSLWQKAPNMQRLGGGVDPIMGDYDDNSIHQKIMHIIGGTLIDPKVMVSSNGSGS